jgi:DNA adenine methylase
MKCFNSGTDSKYFIKKNICERMPENIESYIEVFGGVSRVLFQGARYAQREVYNDYNSEIENLFRCVKYHNNELQSELSLIINSRRLYHDFKTRHSVWGLTDIQRAARFFALTGVYFGSERHGNESIKKDIKVMNGYMEKISKRLAGVIIENKDFESLIKEYDRPDAFIYCEPPYYGNEKSYRSEFSYDDHIRLCKILKCVRGKFILCYNDCGFIRLVYKDFNIEKVNKLHSARTRYRDGKIYSELLIIKNY